jgi:hypothetical protein
MPKIETDTNQLYRKKYFVNSHTIVTADQPLADAPVRIGSPVIDAQRVIMKRDPVPIRSSANANRIRVDVVRDGQRVKGIRIACPCGRHE